MEETKTPDGKFPNQEIDQVQFEKERENTDAEDKKRLAIKNERILLVSYLYLKNTRRIIANIHRFLRLKESETEQELEYHASDKLQTFPAKDSFKLKTNNGIRFLWEESCTEKSPSSTFRVRRLKPDFKEISSDRSNDYGPTLYINNNFWIVRFKHSKKDEFPSLLIIDLKKFIVAHKLTNLELVSDIIHFLHIENDELFCQVSRFVPRDQDDMKLVSIINLHSLTAVEKEVGPKMKGVHVVKDNCYCIQKALIKNKKVIVLKVNPREGTQKEIEIDCGRELPSEYFLEASQTKNYLVTGGDSACSYA